MSFCSTIYGNLPDSGFVYTATTVSVLNGSFENLSATNATIVNLETTTFNPTNVDCTTLTADDATITDITATNATIDNLEVTNFTIDTLNATTANISTINSSTINSSHSNLSTIGTFKINISDAGDSALAGVIRRDANKIFIEGRDGDATDPVARIFLQPAGEFFGGQVPCIVNASNVEIHNLSSVNICSDNASITNLSATDIEASGVIEAFSVEASLLTATSNLSTPFVNTNDLQTQLINSSQINASNISTKNLSAVIEISSTFIKATNRITAPVMNTQLNNVSIINASTINSQIGNFSTTNIINNNVSSVFVKRSTGGIATLDIHQDKLDIDGGFTSPLGAARGVTIRAGNNTVAAIEVEDDNSVTIRNLSSVNFETDNLTADTANATTGNISTLNVSILNASTKNSQTMNASTINCSTINSSFCNAFSMDTSIITSKIYQLEDTSGGGGADGVISESSNVLTIRTGASGGVTKFGTTTGGNFSVQIANDALNASTINSSQINATDIDATTIDADTITGDIGGNLAAGSGISLSTTAGVTTISNTGSVTDPLNLSKLNVSNVSGDNLSMDRASIATTIESAISKATIFEVVDSSGLGGQPNGFIYETANVMTLRTGAVGGVIQFGTTYSGNFSVEIAGDALNASTINVSNVSAQSITSNNIYTPLMAAQYQNVSFMYYDDVQGLSNPGIIYKAADRFQFWSGSGTTKIVFTNDNSNLSVEVANNQLNASVANISTGTIKTLTSTTGTIGQCNIGLINSSMINGDFLNGNIANNLAAGTNITLCTTGGVTTINSTGGGGGVTDPLNLSTLNASTANIAMLNSSMLTSDFINGTTSNISTINTSTSNSQLVNASVVNGDFLNGNIANNLLGGTNITLSTSSGVTTIDGPIRSVFGVMRIGVFTPGNVTDVRVPYNSIKITNSNYSWSGLVLTISQAGTYLVSATCGLVSSTYNNRVVGRIRTLTNGTWNGNADAESFCYLRHDDYGEFESMVISSFPRIFAAGDTLQIQIQVGKASAGGPGASNFSGLVLTPGANLTLEKVA